MKLTEDLKKFINSDYGQKMLREARMLNAEYFTFGRKRYAMKYLRLYIK